MIAVNQTPSPTRGFIGDCDLRLLPNGRDVMMLADFGYVSKALKKYWAHRYDVLNGASIPRYWWRVIGSPFVGLYRRAACLHDSWYLHKPGPRKEGDLMMLEAMEYDGVSLPKRVLMYSVVRQFGPRWEPPPRFPTMILEER